jgi:hypothetical protein
MSGRQINDHRIAQDDPHKLIALSLEGTQLERRCSLLRMEKRGRDSADDEKSRN